MKNLPARYSWLLNEGAPKMLVEALKLYGTKEIVGGKHNPVILDWADELGIGKIVNDDEQAWCGLAMGVIAHRAGKYIPLKSWDILRALKWAEFGDKVETPMLGDVMVFKRQQGGHVALYVGEDATTYHVLGGNQGNEFNITRIFKNRLYAIRRPVYKTGMPTNVRSIVLEATGKLSDNEA